MFVLQRGRVHRHEHVGSSPGVRMSWSEKWIWKPETPGSEPAGARISAGKSGSVDEVVAEQRRLAGEAAAGELHPVAGVAGEADHHLVELLYWLRHRYSARYSTLLIPPWRSSIDPDGRELEALARVSTWRDSACSTSAAETAGSCGGSLRQPNPCSESMSDGELSRPRRARRLRHCAESSSFASRAWSSWTSLRRRFDLVSSPGRCDDSSRRASWTLYATATGC